MKKYSKLVALALSIATAFSLTACGSKPASSSAAPSSSAPAASSAAGGNIGEHAWTLGMDSPKDTVTYFYGQKLSEELAALSGGKMTVDVYTDGTLGGDVALLESCKDGNVTFVVQTTAPEVNFIPELAVFDMPVVYPTIKEFREVFDNADFMGKIAGFYDKAGYKLLGYADQTFRVMSSNKKIEKFADFSGVKIRTMENANHMAFWKAIGASPTPMAFGELYTGLQQGTVTAQENPYAVIAANKLYEVQDYIIQTNHLPHILAMIMNPSEYNALNDEEKAVLEEAVASATVYAREQADVLEAEKTKVIEDSGTEIIPVSAELYAEIKAAAQPVYDTIAQKVGQDLVDAYLGK
ncbi:MAG TPA: TRAP transporter substrate-binding protein [Clostridia bacterium]|nr:TRAP transporter substrate-binding protein [Clostridia bacterium]